MNHVIVAAGGKGERFGSTTSKQLHILSGRPIVSWSLAVFETDDRIEKIILVYPQDCSEKQYEEFARSSRKVQLVAGGATRYDSVRNGFDSLQAAAGDIVLIHDAARPLLSSKLLGRVLDASTVKQCVIPAVPIQETVKEVQQGRVVRTLDRELLYVAQTPQAFRYSVLRDAYDRVGRSANLTDEALLVEKAGFDVCIIEGDRRNLKVTEPKDIQIAELYVKET